MKDFKLSDRSVFLTGPLSTFNQAIARTITQMGANVALVDRNVSSAERFANQLSDEREINERFGKAIAIEADLTKPHHVQDAIAKTAESFGSVDSYVDGLLVHTAPNRFYDENALEDFERILDIHSRSPLLVTHNILKFLKARKRGRIIYLMHDHVNMGLPHNTLLSATRSGLKDFTKSLSREVIEQNITVNCLFMGTTEEYLMNFKKDSQSISDAHKEISPQAPWSKIMDSNKIAEVVAFLLSNGASAMTGQMISVSEGLSV